jgi:hypothetical protein
MNVGDIIPGEGRANESLASKLETRVTEYENDCDMTLHRSGLRNIRPLHARF